MQNKRILVTGSHGFLGRHLERMLVREGFDVRGLGHSELDISDAEAVKAVLTDLHPDIVVNCAAISSTSYAAAHPEESFLINVTGCRILALACRSLGISLYLMSSDQVYAGCAVEGPLGEDLPLTPGNVYGQQKLQMEREVASVNPDAVMLRLTWMCDRPDPDCPHPDFVSNLLSSVRSGLPFRASTREYRGITGVDDVCRNIIASFGVLPGGVYNFGAANTSDTYTTVVRIATAAGFAPAAESVSGAGRLDIVPDDSWGRNLSMDCRKLNSYGIFFEDTFSVSSLFKEA